MLFGIMASVQLLDSLTEQSDGREYHTLTALTARESFSPTFFLKNFLTVFSILQNSSPTLNNKAALIRPKS